MFREVVRSMPTRFLFQKVHAKDATLMFRYLPLTTVSCFICRKRVSLIYMFKKKLALMGL